jgi:hypothetical protein
VDFVLGFESGHRISLPRGRRGRRCWDAGGDALVTPEHEVDQAVAIQLKFALSVAKVMPVRCWVAQGL